MAAALSPKAIEAETGRSWDEWVAYFDSKGASELSHQEIVDLASALGAPPWWRQMVTVAYEQHIGRRVPGQRGDGTFAISASKTITASLDGALERWVEHVGTPADVSGIRLERGPDISSTKKWRYWRCGLSDGSRVTVNISAKSETKSVVSVQHEGLESEEAGEHWRSFWKATLSSL